MRVRVDTFTGHLSAHLANFLLSIYSAPELSSVTFSFTHSWFAPPKFSSSANWVAVDKWLARMVTMRSNAGDGLRAVLNGLPEDEPSWEEYFPEFRRAGGELRREIRDYGSPDPMSILEVGR